MLPAVLREWPAARRAVRPNPRRQLFWVLIAVVAMAVGYVVGVVYPNSRDQAQPPAATSQLAPRLDGAEPWYRNQPPPPSIAGLPDSPIYPDQSLGADDADSRRAYEERLPVEIYVPDRSAAVPSATVSMPPPAPQRHRSAFEAENGQFPAWRQFALAVPLSEGRPRIAIVIDDLGVDKRRTARATALPGPLTMAFLSYATDLDRQTAAARAGGHELLVHVPMQPQSESVDPGPNVLRSDLGGDELLRRLRWCLDRFPGYVGINNHMGSRFTTNDAGMVLVMSELKSRGLLFLDSRTSGASVGARLAVASNVPFAVRNVFLDNENDVAAVRARLAETEAVAIRHGLAIAIGHPRDATLEALPGWLADVVSRGFQLVPISATVTVLDGLG